MPGFNIPFNPSDPTVLWPQPPLPCPAVPAHVGGRELDLFPTPHSAAGILWEIGTGRTLCITTLGTSTAKPQFGWEQFHSTFVYVPALPLSWILWVSGCVWVARLVFQMKLPRYWHMPQERIIDLIATALKYNLWLTSTEGRSPCLVKVTETWLSLNLLMAD